MTDDDDVITLPTNKKELIAIVDDLLTNSDVTIKSMTTADGVMTADVSFDGVAMATDDLLIGQVACHAVYSDGEEFRDSHAVLVRAKLDGHVIMFAGMHHAGEYSDEDYNASMGGRLGIAVDEDAPRAKLESGMRSHFDETLAKVAENRLGALVKVLRQCPAGVCNKALNGTQMSEIMRLLAKAA